MPLEGVRVLDVSQVMAGPFASMLLGDMGADVIKIEPSDGGDQTRRAMGFKLKGNDSLGFFNLNRNKRSFALNLKSKRAREVFYELVKTSDILLENYRPGVTKRLGIDYETLKKINPRLIYASISGFGQTGPWSQRPGFDLIAQAMAGTMSITGHEGGPPTKSGVPVSDIGCALFVVYGIMSCAASAARRRAADNMSMVRCSRPPSRSASGTSRNIGARGKCPDRSAPPTGTARRTRRCARATRIS